MMVWDLLGGGTLKGLGRGWSGSGLRAN